MHRAHGACLLLITACSGPAATPDGGSDAGPVGFVTISTQGYTNCALHSSGRAICWGYSFQTPLVVDGPVSGASAGWYQAWLLAGTTVSCVPAPFNAMRDRHANVPPGNYIEVASGLSITCGLRADRTVDCWGWDEGVQGPERLQPTREPVVRIRLNGDCLCALATSGAVTCWVPIPDPVRPLPLPDGTYRDAVCATFRPACGVDAAGEVRCGPGFCSLSRIDLMTEIEVCHDQLGWDDDGNPLYWADLMGPAPPGPFSEIALSSSLFMCGLRTTGEIVCWGPDYEPLRALEPSGVRFVDLAVGTSHVCGISVSGDIVCWGTLTEPGSMDWGQTRAPVWP